MGYSRHYEHTIKRHDDGDTRCARRGCPNDKYVDRYDGSTREHCSKQCEQRDAAEYHDEDIHETVRRLRHELEVERARAKLTEDDRRTPRRRALMTREQADTSPSIMTTLIQALGLPREDTAMRPHLYICVQASGHDTIYPFNEMVGEPMDLEIEYFLDENHANPETRTEEQKTLQAAVRGDDNETGALTLNSAGELHMVTGRKPRLTKPTSRKAIQTCGDLINALRNLSAYYALTGNPRRAGMIENHTNSIRQLWHHGRFMGKHKHIITFEKRLRALRCRQPGNTTWIMDTDIASAEHQLLTECIYDMQNAHLQDINSQRPSKAPLAANKQGKGGKGTTKSGKGAKKYVPQPFLALHDHKSPKICMQYAYFGTCHRSTGDECKNAINLPLLHVCALCRFKNGKHPINEGKHPSGTCP